MEDNKTMHPMAETILKFVNDAITIEEAKARTSMIAGVVDDLMKGISEFENKVTATTENGDSVDVEEVTE